jgi:hypothetical protein
VYNHVPGLEGVHGFDLDSIRVIFPNVIRFHPTYGSRAAHKPAVVSIREQGAQPVVHGLVAITQAVQNVAHRCDVKVFVNELGDLSGRRKHK